MTDPVAVLRETERIIRDISPQFNFAPVALMFQDVLSLFKGQYNGFQACNTRYHDLQHTTDCLLAQARIIHGAVHQGLGLDDDHIALGLACALMHDTGYIQALEDKKGTGAQYTLTHVDRSIDFMQAYCKKTGGFPGHFQDMADILKCTGLEINLAKLTFSSPEVEFLGKALGTSDLTGQMGDRTYLEKLIYLFEEFLEAGISGVATEYKFLTETQNFYAVTDVRLEQDLDDLRKYYRPHFKTFYKIDRDLYADAMTGNLRFLLKILKEDKENFIHRLRRRGLPAYIEKLAALPSDLRCSA